MTLEEEKYFIKRCKDSLPNLLMVNGVTYKLDAHGLMAGSYRISYGEYTNRQFNWSNKPIDLFYDLVDIIPNKVIIRNGVEFIDSTKYMLSIDEMIQDCLIKLSEWHDGLYKELDNGKPNPDMEYINRLDMGSLKTNTIVNNVINKYNDGYEFTVKETGERLRTYYAWSLAENTPENVLKIEKYDREYLKFKEYEKYLNFLREDIITLDSKNEK